VSPKDPVLRTCWSPPKRWMATTVTQLPIDFCVKAMSTSRATEVVRTGTVRTRNWTMLRAQKETVRECPLMSSLLWREVRPDDEPAPTAQLGGFD
jgi:hypothetical protein